LDVLGSVTYCSPKPQNPTLNYKNLFAKLRSLLFSFENIFT